MPELKDTTIRQAAPRAERYELKDSERPGLRVVIFPTGRKSFLYRYSFGGEYRKLTLGQYGTMTLAQAIAARRDAADALVAGRDPSADLKPKHDDDATVTSHVRQYEKARAPDWSGATASLAHTEMEFMIDRIGAKPIRDVTRKDCQKIVNDALDRGPAAQVACWKWVRAFFMWCYEQDAVSVNVTELIARPRDDTRRDRVLTDAELRKVWKAATDAGGPPGALVKLLVLTGLRRTEATHLQWSEIGDKAITLAGSRTKNGSPHTVPITPAIKRVLGALPRTGAYVVTGADAGLGGHSKARKAIKDGCEHWTFHDLRRTFATGMAKLGVPLAVTELCLNHKSGTRANPLVEIYQRHDYQHEIVAAFKKWNARVELLVGIDDKKLAA
jgi:integrase